MDNPYLPSRRKIRWYRFLAQTFAVTMILVTAFFMWFANILLHSMSDWVAVQACVAFTVLIFAIVLFTDWRRGYRATFLKPH